MRLLTELLTNDVGLMSAAGLLFMLGMAVFFLRYFFRHMRGDEARSAAQTLKLMLSLGSDSGALRAVEPEVSQSRGLASRLILRA